MARSISRSYYTVHHTFYGGGDIPPACKNCVYFRKAKDVSLWKDIHETGIGRCALFGKIDLETGKIENCYAVVARAHEDMCGMYGRYFKPKYI